MSNCLDCKYAEKKEVIKELISGEKLLKEYIYCKFILYDDSSVKYGRVKNPQTKCPRYYKGEETI